ncbi:copper chaperone [Pseudomonas sp. SJZ079]|uniref:heavy-metal-associated domain-containing protein n=1 Tax=Pseudomonas sp. SJZ079 TaxID=2572887 RepID=UPI00119B284B|nr:heavy-metal-associated domain-containing protein [Pseudomonas sp. SJZ079]TWC43158.1 copper chaperone [Pseudomonas sp. SJZ079]
MFVLEVSGMGCGSCVSKITRAIKADDAEASVSIDRPSGKVRVESTESPEHIGALIEALGYPVKIAR